MCVCLYIYIYITDNRIKANKDQDFKVRIRMAEEQKVQIPRVKLGTHGFEVNSLSGFDFFN